MPRESLCGDAQTTLHSAQSPVHLLCTDFRRWTALSAAWPWGEARASTLVQHARGCPGPRLPIPRYVLKPTRDATATCKRDCVRERVRPCVERGTGSGRPREIPGGIGLWRHPPTRNQTRAQIDPPDARVRVPLRSPGTVVRLGGVVFGLRVARSASVSGLTATLVCTVALGQSLKLAIITSGTPHSTHTT